MLAQGIFFLWLTKDCNLGVNLKQIETMRYLVAVDDDDDDDWPADFERETRTDGKYDEHLCVFVRLCLYVGMEIIFVRVIGY